MSCIQSDTLQFFLHAGATLGGQGHSVISVSLPQDAVSEGIGRMYAIHIKIEKFTPCYSLGNTPIL